MSSADFILETYFEDYEIYDIFLCNSFMTKKDGSETNETLYEMKFRNFLNVMPLLFIEKGEFYSKKGFLVPF